MNYSSMFSAIANTLFDFNVDSLIHYRHNYYISVSADREVMQFQLGNNAYNNASCGELYGYDSIGMMNDGAISFNLGKSGQGVSVLQPFYMCIPYIKGLNRWLSCAAAGS